jgi:hypothetical protein
MPNGTEYLDWPTPSYLIVLRLGASEADIHGSVQPVLPSTKLSSDHAIW